MTDDEDWFPPPLLVGGEYEEKNTQVEPASTMLEDDDEDAIFLVKATQAEVDHLANCYIDELDDVQVLASKPLALYLKPRERDWQLRELIKLRGEDRFEFYPVVPTWW